MDKESPDSKRDRERIKRAQFLSDNENFAANFSVESSKESTSAVVEVEMKDSGNVNTDIDDISPKTNPTTNIAKDNNEATHQSPTSKVNTFSPQNSVKSTFSIFSDEPLSAKSVVGIFKPERTARNVTSENAFEMKTVSGAAEWTEQGDLVSSELRRADDPHMAALMASVSAASAAAHVKIPKKQNSGLASTATISATAEISRGSDLTPLDPYVSHYTGGANRGSESEEARGSFERVGDSAQMAALMASLEAASTATKDKAKLKKSKSVPIQTAPVAATTTAAADSVSEKRPSYTASSVDIAPIVTGSASTYTGSAAGLSSESTASPNNRRTEDDKMTAFIASIAAATSAASGSSKEKKTSFFGSLKDKISGGGSGGGGSGPNSASNTPRNSLTSQMLQNDSNKARLRTSSGGRISLTAVDENEDGDQEGHDNGDSINNLLTADERKRLTTSQKAAWQAKYTDLTVARRNFHGVVTYAFDGIFSWQMYGSAESVDEKGKPYTEYLMRVQWGTTFDNMKPWIVAHRYSEFNSLDAKLRKIFPNLEKNMPVLPKKDFLNSKKSDFILQRRAALEIYMNKVIQTMPSIIRSDAFNEFLSINERIHMYKLSFSTIFNEEKARISSSSV